VKIAPGIVAVLAAGLLIGCTADDIRVSDVALAEASLHLSPDGPEGKPRSVFSSNDEKVTLSVLFAHNYVGTFQWYKVEWLRPDGKVYLRKGTRALFGRHDALEASMPIRGTPAATFFPGKWKVRLYLEDRLLVEKGFEIRRDRRVTTWGLESAEGAPRTQRRTDICPPVLSPRGDCIDTAPGD
jgi:hypothetical protein